MKNVLWPFAFFLLETHAHCPRSQSFLESKVKHSVLLSPDLGEVQPLAPRFILERKQNFTRPSVGWKIKDTEVKIKEEGRGGSQGEGEGGRCVGAG